MAETGDVELANFLRLLDKLSPQDQRFMHRLIVELSRRDWVGDPATIEERILEVTRQMAPSRVGWVRRWLGR
jgi:Fe-S-cluster formation regulator IscX/YfhJ